VLTPSTCQLNIGAIRSPKQRSYREKTRMESSTPSASASKKMYWAGWVVSILPVLMLLFSATMKFLQPAEMLEGLEKMGWKQDVMIALGIVEVACTIIYLIPKTSVLGAILLTGYLGGATATHVRIGDPFIFPILLGVLVWLGIYLRCGRLRAILPIRT
jgi:hypothetical protein